MKNTTNDIKDELVAINANVKYPFAVEYTGQGEPDTMYLNMDNEKILITPQGKAFNKHDSLIFDLKLEDDIEQIYFQKIDSDLVAIFVETDGDGSGSCAKRISLNTNKVVWAKQFGGFNMHRPLIVDNYAYISTIGFVGKLDLDNGEFKWQFDNLYENGKYNSFDEPKFFENNKVLFLSKMLGKSVSDSILIDDHLGRILRKN